MPPADPQDRAIAGREGRPRCGPGSPPVVSLRCPGVSLRSWTGGSRLHGTAGRSVHAIAPDRRTVAGRDRRRGWNHVRAGTGPPRNPPPDARFRRCVASARRSVGARLPLSGEYRRGRLRREDLFWPGDGGRRRSHRHRPGLSAAESPVPTARGAGAPSLEQVSDAVRDPRSAGPDPVRPNRAARRLPGAPVRRPAAAVCGYATPTRTSGTGDRPWDRPDAFAGRHCPAGPRGHRRSGASCRRQLPGPPEPADRRVTGPSLLRPQRST